MKTSSLSPSPCGIKPPLRLLLAFACAILGGCASPQFTPWVGEQRAWPTASGALVTTDYALPIYDGLPSRPYIVLGVCKSASRHPSLERRAVVTEGQKQRADALILLRSDLLNGGTVGGAQTYGYSDAWGHYYGSTVTSSRQIYLRVETYALIRWQTNAPVASATTNLSTDPTVIPTNGKTDAEEK